MVQVPAVGWRGSQGYDGIAGIITVGGWWRDGNQRYCAYGNQQFSNGWRGLLDPLCIVCLHDRHAFHGVRYGVAVQLYAEQQGG